MIWACFSYYRVGPIHWIRGIMVPTCTSNLNNEQQNNDQKHNSKKGQKWIKGRSLLVMDLPAESPDVYSIENLLSDVKLFPMET